MHQIFKNISDQISFIISKYETSNYTQVETLYLLTIITELGKDYWIDELTIVKYFGGSYNRNKTIIFDSELNYFAITVLLFYMRDKKRYLRIRDALKLLIIKKLKLKKDFLDKDTECILLLLDCISCPYLDDKFKKRILRIYGIKSNQTLDKILQLNTNWFTKWKDFEFGKELDAKQSQEVY